MITSSQFESRLALSPGEKENRRARFEASEHLVANFSADAPSWLSRAQASETKDKLRSETKIAEELGIFGAPSFVTRDGELFWGNDRLEAALKWSLSH